MLKKLLIPFFFLFLFTNNMQAQCPNITVTAGDTQYCYSDLAQFSVSGVPAGSIIEWNLGSGYDTSGTTYSAVLGASGLIDVLIRLTLPDGTVCNHVEYDVTRIIPALQASFTASRYILCSGPDTLTLFDKTTNSVSRNWLVNGNPVSNAAQAQNVFISQNGTTDLTLIVTDQHGCRTVASFDDTIKTYPSPNLSIAKSNTTDKCIPYTTNFTSSFNTGQSIDSMRWDLPGSTKPKVYTQNALNVGYNNAGQYPVTFSIFTSEGCTYQLSDPKLIQLGDTQTIAAIAQKYEVCVSEKVLLQETVKPLPGVFTWTIGATYKKPIGKYDLEVSFRDTGYYNLSLTYSYFGCVSTLQIDSFIHVIGISGAFTSSERFHCDTPFTVNLTNTTDTNLNVSSFLWRLRFADNDSVWITANTRDLSVTVDSMPVAYTVELITEDQNGCRDSLVYPNYINVKNYQFEVSAARPPIACVGQRVRITTNTAKGSAYGPDFYRWVFFDTDSTTVLSKFNGRAASHVYTDTGIYSIRLIMNNNFGCLDSIDLYDTVQVIESVVDYALSDSFICLGDSILCEGTSQPEKASFAYTWRFKHLSTGQTYTFTGDSVYAALPVVGEYSLSIVHQISQGCLDSLQTSVYVNGVSGTIVLDDASGCSPFTVYPTYQVNTNTYIGGSDSTINFNWFVNPPGGVTVIGAATANPEITFAGPGDYEISVFLTNSSGCGNYNAQTSNVLIGVKAQFSSNKIDACTGDEIRIRNISTNQPSSSRWIIQPPTSVTMIPNAIDTKRTDFFFQDTGIFNITLIVEKDSQCYDTFSRTVFIQTIIADYNLSDTILYCAPQSVELFNTSFNADSIRYIFNQGPSLATDTGSVTYTFTNNGYQNIRAIAKNSAGCRDTLDIDSAVLILGPIPAFSPDVLSGCEPLTVQFTDESQFTNTLRLDFADGSSDSIPPLQHTYTRTNGLAFQDFRPFATASDTFGCTETRQLDTFIRVYANPEPLANLSPDTILCQNSILYFSSLGGFVDSVQWVFNNQVISNRLSDSLQVQQIGINILKLYVFNAAGCIDSSIHRIRVNEIPFLELLLDTVSCLNAPFQVTANVGGVTSVDNFAWNFGEPSNPNNIQNTTQNTASINYMLSGIKKLNVDILLATGCTNRDSAWIEVLDPNNIVPVDLDYVSVNNAGTIDLFHSGVNYLYKEQFNYYRNDSLMYTETDTSARNWSDMKVLYGPDNYCYHITLTDICGNESAKINSHCPVILDVTSTVHKQNDLEWTAYVGWPAVQRYEIFRTDPDGNTGFLAQVPGSVTNYTDAPLCPGLFTYEVRAIKAPENYISRSNLDAQIPLYVRNTVIPHIRVASVTEAEEISLDWPASTYAGFDYFEVEKFENNLLTPVQLFVTDQTQLLDPDVNTSNTSYIYEIREVDDCDSVTGPGRYGKTIVLEGTRLEAETQLSWSAYEDWQFGVDRYEVLVKEMGMYRVIATVPGTQLNYLDRGVHQEDAEGRYQYRVRAINSSNDTSYSNLIYITGGPIVFVPNAFSPNKDGINDEFKISTIFVKNSSEIKPTDFQIDIYNRWGQMIFTSNNRDFAWDGTYQDKPVQQGVYFYVVKYTESKGFKTYGNGTVTVLR